MEDLKIATFVVIKVVGLKMTESKSQSAGSNALRPRARILRTFGDELISSETVALIELVKNAYDADATRVLIRFGSPLKIGHGKIEVIDNGNGMSLETIRNTWMEPATLIKRHNIRSEQRGRRVLGEKGIGRFATSKLTDILEVVTRRINTDQEVWVLFDWKQFDNEEKYLDQIEARWFITKPKEVCPGGTVEDLWQQDRQPDNQKLSHGTILRMKELRTAWDENLFVNLRKSLSRLISPFFKQSQNGLNEQFRIFLELPEPFESLSGEVEPPELLMSPHYTLRGSVAQDGSSDLTIKLPERDSEEEVTSLFSMKNGEKPKCGPFEIEFRVWDRDQLGDIAQKYGSTISQVRRDLDSAAGVNVYRDGFRILPYGELGNDWLGLDARRVQNPTLRLSNNQIVGYVLISADNNPSLRDQTNREGLIEGEAFNDLREVVKKVLAELEQRRFNIRHPDSTSQGKPQPGGIFDGFDLKTVRNTVRQQYPNDKKLVALLEETEKDLDRRVKEVQDVLSRYRRLTLLGQLIDMVLHEGRAPLSKIRNEADLGYRNIERTRVGNGSDDLFRRLRQRFDVIITQSDALALVFRKIEPFGGRKRGRPARVSLEKVVSDAFDVLDAEISRVGVQVNLPDTNTPVTVDQAEIQQVIIILLKNSLYWLLQAAKDRRKISVQVNRRNLSEVEILFSDSGPGVNPEFRERIFEPYFSTKSDGVGLGLAIAGEIVAEYYAGSLELVDSGPLLGATFRILLRKRV